MMSYNVNQALSLMIDWAIQKGYTRLSKKELLKSYEDIFHTSFSLEEAVSLSKEEAVEILVDFGFQKQCFHPNTVSERDAFEALLYDVIMSSKEEMRQRFVNHQPKESDLISLYQLSLDVNYIKEKRNQNNVSWDIQSPYGSMSLTINLAKPEKDPRDIKEAKDINIEGRPKCVLCKENEGNYWNARKNLRLIPLKLNEDTWYFQYSPYAYYPYHSIILHEDHIPMKMDRSVISALVDFVDQFPDFMIGSNAEIPIVGGSILNHLHFQGGKHIFPIENASILTSKTVLDVTYEKLYWPISTIKIQSKNKNAFVNAVMNVYHHWLHYRNEDLEIIPFTNANHQTITPVIRHHHGKYVAYIMLRNNRTSILYPEGIFHPHPHLFHIKKENIGLIEAMGLAILPGRLKEELMDLEKYIYQNGSLEKHLNKHVSWMKTFKNKEHIDLHAEVGYRFIEVLEDAGVFKQNSQGQVEFEKFFKSIIKTT
ncbi:MAG: DUF4922 domain-containing protein [Firmicutes bacterium]|nr:DUF4922 domain-containing protein [Bacillota bacterium]